MNNNSHSKTLVTPWTLKVFNTFPVSTAWIGVSFAILLFLLFILGWFLLGPDAEINAGDFRLTIVHILLTAYISSAYVYLLQAARSTVLDMESELKHTRLWQQALDEVGKYNRWHLLATATLVFLVYVYYTNVTTTGSDPWDWAQSNYEARWMRVLGPFLSGWTGCLLYVVVIESSRLSRLSENIIAVDLFNLQPYIPLLKFGLTNALLVVGNAAVLSLFLLEPGYVTLMIQTSPFFAVFAGIALILPLSGIRQKIAITKANELEWCSYNLRIARDQLKTGLKTQRSITEIMAYQSLIEKIRNWPFDSPTLTRFALYLLIPFGSMLGGALVERGLDFFLS